MLRKTLIAAAGLAVVAATPASAAVYISVVDNGVELNPTFNITPLDAGTGLAAPTFTSGDLTVTFDVTGKGSSAFSAPDPQFLTQALSVVASGGSSHIVNIRVSQNGLTSPTPGFAVTESLNTQLATLTGNATAQAYIGANQFDMTTPIGSLLTCPQGSNCSNGPVITAAAHGSPFSETVQYQFTLTGGRLQANTQIGAALPEPATWAMMLIGFGGVGFAMRRRKDTKSTQRVRFANI